MTELSHWRFLSFAENFYRIFINFRQIYDIMDKRERKESASSAGGK